MDKRFNTVHCGCTSPHAVTKSQRAYARRALDMAYTMGDRTAIAKIRDALKPCRTDKTFSNIAATTIIAHMQGVNND